MGSKLGTLELLSKLIAFDTTSSKSNMDMIRFIQEYLHDLGVTAAVLPDETGAKANMFATIGPDVSGGICLSGHTDVVPTMGQPWDTPPFEMTIRDDRIFGRGTCDMKGFIALALAFVPKFQAAKLKKPIHFAFSYDEELGCTGVGHMVEEIGKILPKPRIVIIGEPTGMGVVNGHKGLSTWRTTVTGFEAHSSQTHLGVNSICAASEIIQELSRISQQVAKDAPPDRDFHPPCSTVNVGVIRGGTAFNIIPRECYFDWDIRLMPGFDADYIPRLLNEFVDKDLLPRLQKQHGSCGVESVRDANYPAFQAGDDTDAEVLVKQLLGTNKSGTVSYGTEAGIFHEAGISAVVCGPGHIAQAHQPNEFIDISELDACSNLFEKITKWASE